MLPFGAQRYLPFRVRVFKHGKITLRKYRKFSTCALLSFVIVTNKFIARHSRNVWVPTLGCYGLSLPAERKLDPVKVGNSIELGANSGFCLCDAFWIAEPKNCGHGPVDCEVACRKISSRTRSDTVQAANSCPNMGWGPRKHSVCFDITLSSAEAKKLFSDVHAITLTHHLRYSAPGMRSTRSDDFVFKGEHMQMKDLRAISRGIARFVESIPAVRNFEGRGIVIVGGSKKRYQTSYWVAVLSIRRVDHDISIELWFPEDELPNCRQLARLAELQVSIRTFEDITSQTAKKHTLSGYAYKIVAMTFSSFEEVLLLDADNIVMRSPQHLFESDSYRQTGSLLWKDFWLQSRAPEASMLGAKSLPGNNTHESGQMLVNKKRAWKPLLLAYYMNSFPGLFYPLSVNFMGLGDKELFPLAAAYLGYEYGLVEKGPDHVGVMSDRMVVYGNTMMQHDVLGSPIFLHANVGKWSSNVPVSFASYIRRWQVSALHGTEITSVLRKVSEIDLEHWIYDTISQLKATCLLKDEDVRWYEQLNIGPLVDGMYLTDYFNIKYDLELFNDLRSKGYTFNK